MNKKKFDNLFYTGLLLIGGPIFFICILMTLPLVFDGKKTTAPVTKTITVYDTVPVKKIIKVYDTIPVQKIRWIEKVKSDSIN